MAGGQPTWPNRVVRSQARGNSENWWPKKFVTRLFRMRPVPLSVDLENGVLPGLGSEIVTHRPPCSGQIQRWPAAGKSMIDSAIAAAREALDPWRAIGTQERLKSLQALRNQLKDHRAVRSGNEPSRAPASLVWRRGDSARANEQLRCSHAFWFLENGTCRPRNLRRSSNSVASGVGRQQCKYCLAGR